MNSHRIVIVSDGYFGTAAFYYLEKQLTKVRQPIDLLLISTRDSYCFSELLTNYLCDTLSHVDLGQNIRDLNIIKPGISFLKTKVLDINLNSKIIKTTQGNIDYQYLILALENSYEELQEGFKANNKEDIIHLKAHINKTLESACNELNQETKRSLLTFSIVSSKSSGIEVACAISDYVTMLIKKSYPELNSNLLKVNLIEEANIKISNKCPYYNSQLQNNLNKRKINVYPSSIIINIKDKTIEINNEQYLSSGTLIYCPKTRENDLLKKQTFKRDDLSRIFIDLYLRIDGFDNVFAIGPLSQCLDIKESSVENIIFYNKQARICANNVISRINNNLLKPFKGSIDIDFLPLGYKNTIVSIKDFYFTGFIAWLFYRITYICFFLGWKKKLRACISLLLNVFKLKEDELLNIYEVSKEREKVKI